MRQGATQRQLEILAFMRKFQEENGCPPKMKEIADHFGLKSENTVWGHLNRLSDHGLLARPSERGRSYVAPKRAVAALRDFGWEFFLAGARSIAEVDEQSLKGLFDQYWAMRDRKA